MIVSVALDDRTKGVNANKSACMVVTLSICYKKHSDYVQFVIPLERVVTL